MHSTSMTPRPDRRGRGVSLFLSLVAAGSLALLPSVPANAAAAPRRIEINPRGASDPAAMTALKGRVYFVARAPGLGRELWSSDGTRAGTRLVKDIRPGRVGSGIKDLLVAHGRLWFVANDGRHGMELWASDGTATGTRMVKDINPGAGGSAPRELTPSPTRLFLTANDGTHGRELWVTDGTRKGTRLVVDIDLVWSEPPQWLAAVGETLFFRDDALGGSSSLWGTDGTEEGTTRIWAQAERPQSPFELTAVGDRLFFGARIKGEDGRGLWVSDGTDDGTVRVRRMPWLSDLHEIDGTLWFQGGAVNGAHPWTSDGTPGGTSRVSKACSFAEILQPLPGMVLLSCQGGTDTELWRSDGTDEGTVLVKNLNPDGPSRPGDPGEVIIAGAHVGSTAAAIDGIAYFPATGAGWNTELWRSDGTDAGTWQVADLASGSSGPADLAAVNGVLFFSADDGTHGRELWRYRP